MVFVTKKVESITTSNCELQGHIFLSMPAPVRLPNKRQHCLRFWNMTAGPPVLRAAEATQRIKSFPHITQFTFQHLELHGSLQSSVFYQCLVEAFWNGLKINESALPLLDLLLWMTGRREEPDSVEIWGLPLDRHAAMLPIELPRWWNVCYLCDPHGSHESHVATEKLKCG